MKKISLALTVFLLSLVALAPKVSAHERQVFQIGSKNYQFVVGSLNEPVFVDDKTGVELRVQIAPNEQEGHTVTTPIEGLEKTLKVEISAGDKKKEFALEPAYKDPGAYKAAFFPTVATTLTYRFFGTINSIPFDYGFTCNPAGHPVSPEDKTVVKISDKVSRTLKTGSFGCPRPKAEAGFPEPSAAIAELASSVTTSGSMMTSMHESANTTELLAIVGSVSGLGALALGLFLFSKRKNS